MATTHSYRITTEDGSEYLAHDVALVEVGPFFVRFIAANGSDVTAFPNRHNPVWQRLDFGVSADGLRQHVEQMKKYRDDVERLVTSMKGGPRMLNLILTVREDLAHGWLASGVDDPLGLRDAIREALKGDA